jgi:hypothetical protein
MESYTWFVLTWRRKGFPDAYPVSILFPFSGQEAPNPVDPAFQFLPET